MKIRIKENLRKIPNFFRKITHFLKEVRVEMKKIHWLGLKETFKYTLIVIFVSILVAAFLGGVDFGLTAFLNKFVF